MKKYNVFIISSLIVIGFINSSCEKDEITNKEQNTFNVPKTTESEFFSVNFCYTDTIRLLDQDNNYVDIVVSSDKKEVLNTHLSKNQYVLSEVNRDDDITSISSFQPITKLNYVDEKYVFEQYDIADIPKIRVEVIDVNENIKKFGIKCKSNEKSISGMQKVPFNPNPWYYEYTSPGSHCYGKLKYTNDGDGGLDIPATRVRYGYRSCWLFCAWISWPEGDWLVLDPYSNGYLFSINSFGKDGFNFTGYKIYQLCTGVLSYSPYNHEPRWNNESEGPVPNW